jgi:alcohol dehydrogenase class IV
MREQWGFSTARELIFGQNSVKRLSKVLRKLNCKYPVVFTDLGVKNAGLIEKIENPLKEVGIDFRLFDHGETEPSVEFTLEAYEWAKKEDHDVVIGLGGGSVIDLSKAVSILLAFGGDLNEYFGEGKIPGLPLPIIAIPTTSGTGSSVSPASVLTDKAANLKKGISDNRLRPTVALVDPLLTVTCLSLHALGSMFSPMRWRHIWRPLMPISRSPPRKKTPHCTTVLIPLRMNWPELPLCLSEHICDWRLIKD